MEASLTPMTFKFFQWETQQNSLCYVYLGVCCLFGYIALMVLQGHSKIKLMDRTALLIGALGVGAAQLIGFFTFPLGYYGSPWIFPVFMGVLALCLATLVCKTNNVDQTFILFLAVHACTSSLTHVKVSPTR
jgi:hypothetical protein